ncbi:hypothetical protein BGZ83_006261 [Gryganskiella cystojenkinii]|nr:hypothetical protein BGZ83_006261 [Gryganskiella cystojenkinii]
MACIYVNVASLVPDQRNCNLKLRVLSVETFQETIHPETGKVTQSAEAIVGDDTACILLDLRNDQVNFLARNARLQLLNAKVNMHRGFMRLQVDEDDETVEHGARPSISAIMDEDGEDVDISSNQNDEDIATTAGSTVSSLPFVLEQSALSSIGSPILSRSMTPNSSSESFSSGSSSPSSLSSPSSSGWSSPSSNRNQLDVKMRLGTGGSVPLMEYYRAIEFTYFSTVEPVGR